MEEVTTIQPAQSSVSFHSDTDQITFICKQPSIKEQIFNYIDNQLEQKLTFLKQPKFIFGWFAISSFASIILVGILAVMSFTPVRNVISKYSVFASKPFVLGATSEKVLSADARAAALEGVLEKFDCPMQGMGRTFVDEADKNGIPYWLAPAIAFQESSCGKKTPEKDGMESYNGWGWGVWGDNVKMFDRWEDGIATVSKYLADRFYSKGVTDPCEIMKVYTPPSNGSWCNGVNYFREVITEYETPDR